MKLSRRKLRFLMKGSQRGFFTLQTFFNIHFVWSSIKLMYIHFTGLKQIRSQIILLLEVFLVQLTIDGRCIHACWSSVLIECFFIALHLALPEGIDNVPVTWEEATKSCHLSPIYAAEVADQSSSSFWQPFVTIQTKPIITKGRL